MTILHSKKQIKATQILHSGKYSLSTSFRLIYDFFHALEYADITQTIIVLLDVCHQALNQLKYAQLV